jgi:hypothetical protein
MKISFKKLKKDEIVCLRFLHKEAFPGEFIRDFSEDHCWLIFDGKGEEIGFCTLKVLEGEVFFSRSASFKPGYGIHRKSIYYRLKWMRNNGHTDAITYVHKDNFQSLANLIRCGFRIYHPETNWAGKDYFCLQRTA